MRKIRCAIVDDEPLAIKLIESFISRTPFLQHEFSFSDSVEAMGVLRDDPVDLVFLDIQMPDMDGLELSHVIPRQTRIIFTTAFREYAFDSYEVSAIDFLLKPIRYDKFLRACEKAREWFELKEGISGGVEDKQSNPLPISESTPSPDIFIRVDGEIRRLPLSDILFIEGMKDYVKFHLYGDKRHLVSHLTLKSLEEILPGDKFMRISRSHIIAVERIRTVDRNMCVYIGESVIRVTDMYRPGFEEYLHQRLAK